MLYPREFLSVPTGAVARSMSLLKQREQHHAFQVADRQQTDRAREEAEALFRPKPKLVKPSTLIDPSPGDDAARKPRILSASAPPPEREGGKALINSEPQTAVSQAALSDREQLNRARVAILDQRRELQAKLEAINREMRALDAYEKTRRLLSLPTPRKRSR